MYARTDTRQVVLLHCCSHITAGYIMAFVVTEERSQLLKVSSYFSHFLLASFFLTSAVIEEHSAEDCSKRAKDTQIQIGSLLYTKY